MPDRPHRPHLVIADAVRVYAGAERFVLDAARGLAERGWPVTVLAYPGAPLAQRARAMGLRVHTARTRANGAPWVVGPLIAWIRRERVGALLSVYDKDLRTAAWAARLAGRDIAIVHSRECDERIKDRPWIRFFHTRVADRVIVNSEATRATTSASAPWLPSERLSVVPKGIDPAPFDAALARPPGHQGRPELVFGFAGQLVARKRVGALLDALAALDGPGARPWILRIAGEGPLLSDLRARCAALGIDARVHFDGYVQDLPGWFTGIDALVLPSWVEGWGYVLAEAGAAGRAVIAYDASSVPEVTPESAGALLADPADPGSLERALRALIAEGHEGCARRGRALRAHVERHLGIAPMIDELDRVLVAELARRRAR